MDYALRVNPEPEAVRIAGRACAGSWRRHLPCGNVRSKILANASPPTFVKARSMSSNFSAGGSNQFGDFNPYQSPQAAPAAGQSAGGGREAALAKVRVPAIILMVLAPLGILLCALDGGVRAMNIVNDTVPMQGMNMDAPGVKAGYYVGMYGMLVAEVLGFLLQFVVIFGAYHMLMLKSRMLAMAANVISVIPCITACCVLGIPFGIWGLVVINDSAVKPFFES